MDERFGPYELLEKLGEGGMGSVYRATHRELNRDVALKLIRTGEQLQKNSAQRFQREMRLMARLSHPRIVKIYDGGRIDGVDYLSMELIRGDSLRSAFTQK